ncbi:peptide/nickel transport system permease protein [Microterricola gilva]|uniref:Peptide/nickel transport system permease protein n=1 Tax=Microterricola gilva TaxID=393267 RepID=A0A4Q8ALC6_9MICO|nr:ABC transporter permease [Microterricola gilva]RZU65362.1 peptide/nickel transport system permease protein [Microterricola gilva]
MGRYLFIAKRLALAIPLLFGIVLLVFLILKITPGDPARLIVGLRASEPELQLVREQLGLNDPAIVQYFRYVGDVFSGNLGYSFKSREAVSSIIAERLPVTIWLLGFGALLSLVISVPLAILSARAPDRPFDHATRGFSLVALAMPSFWVGIILILTVALPTGWFPVGGFGETPAEHLRSIALPAFTLALSIAPLQVRSLRASIIAVLGTEHVTTAKSLGVPRSRIMSKFVLRNAAPPTVSILALNIGYLLFGAVVVETTFALPGIGQGIVLAARQRDIPTIQGYTLLFAVVVVLVFLIADILTSIADPRLEVES